MTIEDDILKLIKAAGFKINETIEDSLADFLDVVEDENEGMEVDVVDAIEAEDTDDKEDD